MFSKSIFHVEPKSGRTHSFATKNARDNNQANHFASEPDGNDNWLSITTPVEMTLQLVLNLHKFEVNFNQYLSLQRRRQNSPDYERGFLEQKFVDRVFSPEHQMPFKKFFDRRNT